MSTYYESDYARALRRQITWDETRSKAADLLARGKTKQAVADAVGVTRMTIYNWLADSEFAAEVDRLTVMVGLASRAERIRQASRVLEARRDDRGILRSDKDSLDWVKYIQSETDGAKIDLSKLAELLTGEVDGPSASQPLLSAPEPAIETTATDMDQLALPDVVGPTDDNHNP